MKTAEIREKLNLLRHREIRKDKEKRMKMTEIKKKAIALAIIPGKMRKIELVHAIQQAEGNAPCFERSNGSCLYNDCCFIGDCLKVRQ